MLAVVIVVSAVSFPLMLRVWRAVRAQNEEAASREGEMMRAGSQFGAMGEEARRWGASPAGRGNRAGDVMAPLRISDSRFPFSAAFACGVGELPFQPSQITHAFVSFELGVSIADDVDYLLIFLDEPVASRFSEQGWPDAWTLLQSVSPPDVRGMIENINGRLSVFTTMDEVAAELARLLDKRVDEK